MSYRFHGALNAAPPPEADETDASMNPLAPLTTSRGFVRVPTYDVRQYVQTTLLTMAIGFGIGVGVGAVFGNILRDKKAPGLGRLVGNRRRTSRRRARRRCMTRNAGRRRTSARRRKRGRPSGSAVSEVMTVIIDRRPIDVVVERGSVLVDGRRCGSVYDLGTSFRAVPAGGGEVRSFGTLAGAVKHVLRQTEAA